MNRGRGPSSLACCGVLLPTQSSLGSAWELPAQIIPKALGALLALSNAFWGSLGRQSISQRFIRRPIGAGHHSGNWGEMGWEKGWSLKGSKFTSKNHKATDSNIDRAYWLLKGSHWWGVRFVPKSSWRGSEEEQRCTGVSSIFLGNAQTALISGFLALLGYLLVVLSPGLSRPNLASMGHPLLRPSAQALCPHWGWVMMEALCTWP